MKGLQRPSEPDRELPTNGATAAITQRVRAITAGLSPAELRAIARGEPPTERPNPRYLAHMISFILHIRPRYYPAASTWFTHTFRLGFFSVFLLGVEIVTGLVLMLYYVPTPEGAYASILRLSSAVPFGALLRDMHRLAAEAMVVVVFLHMVRTYMTGAYKGVRSFTWLTGVLLLLLTLLLSFSGYLLPWDQLAYWAVTIGTSMASAAPVFGHELNLLLRGAADIGADGLLRFYLLHVVLLPLAAIGLVSVHYYKVARSHGISLPAYIEEGDPPPPVRQEATRRIDFIPDLLTHELLLASLGALALVAAAAFFYDAPLESHADPTRTPVGTRAPWFFLWVQGLLKLGDTTLMGVLVPTLAVALLLALPYLDRNPARRARRRPLAIGLGALALAGLGVLSFMGTPRYGIELPAAVRIAQQIASQEATGPLRAVPYDELTPGIYVVEETEAQALPPALADVFFTYAAAVVQARERGDLPAAHASLSILERQKDLKSVLLLIRWQVDGEEDFQSYERTVYIHRERAGDESPERAVGSP